MNHSMIIYFLGWIFKLEAAFLLLPISVALIYSEPVLYSYVSVMLFSLGIGLACTFKKPKDTVFYAREGFVAVALSWLVLGVVGAAPYIISNEIPNFINALFESISGFTTTGASILTDVEGISKSSLMWRSFTIWIGGMGVLVFMLAILPLAGGHSIHLMRAEVPGPAVGKFAPKLRSTAIILYGIYFFLTAVQIILLVLGGMPLFDAVATSFSTTGTGGFGLYNDSLMSFTPYSQVVIAVFMLLCGINFNVFYLILFRRGEQSFRFEELRYYIGIVLFATCAIAFDIREFFTSFPDALRHAFVQAASIVTTTGFATVDYNLWPTFSKTLILLLMFIGACAGSTGGGLKVSRVLLMVKTVAREVSYLVHPRNVRILKLEDKRVNDSMIRSVHVFIVTYFVIFATSVLLVSINELDFVTSVTAVAATLNNVGPGFEMVGPMGNFSAFNGFSKLVLILNMLVGRLEIFPVLILFAPATWKK